MISGYEERVWLSAINILEDAMYYNNSKVLVHTTPFFVNDFSFNFL